MVQTTRNFQLSDQKKKKTKTGFLQPVLTSVDAILEDASLAEINV